MIRKVNVAASVVLYNSTVSCLEGIETYRKQVGKLYVIDNSEGERAEISSYLIGLSNVVYIQNKNNGGIGSALNRAATAAINDGFTHLLTMDDDTAVSDDLVATMVLFLNQYENADQVGIVAALHSNKTSEKVPVSGYRKLLITMTSGNLLNLNIYQHVGPFREDFFIDHVDHEYCLRLVKANYEVIELPRLVLKHQLGELKLSRWSGRNYVSHSPFRSYYYIRNGLILLVACADLHPAFRFQLIKLLVKEVGKTLLFERDKRVRLWFMWRGVTDAIKGQMGKLPDKSRVIR